MIGWERSTKNERDVLATALSTYDLMLVDILDTEMHANVIADAQWRHYQAQELLESLRRQ